MKIKMNNIFSRRAKTLEGRRTFWHNIENSLEVSTTSQKIKIGCRKFNKRKLFGFLAKCLNYDSVEGIKLTETYHAYYAKGCVHGIWEDDWAQGMAGISTRHHGSLVGVHRKWSMIQRREIIKLFKYLAKDMNYQI